MIYYSGLQLYNLTNHPGLCSILPSLSSLLEEDYWKKWLFHSKDKKLLLAEDHTEYLPVIQITTNYIFGILNEYVLKRRLKKKTIILNSDENNSKEINKETSGHKIDEIDAKEYDHLNIHLF